MPPNIIIDFPANNPSKPSNQLSALVIPTIQIMVIKKLKGRYIRLLLDIKFGKYSIGYLKTLKFNQTWDEIKTWIKSLNLGDKGLKSSIKPIKKIKVEKTIRYFNKMSVNRNKWSIWFKSNVMKLPKKIAIPPSLTTL